MFSKILTKQSTNDFSVQINKLHSAIENSDAIVIGAGAGLSTSAGFTYSGECFLKYFSDFANKYGFQDMYSSGFYSFSSLEEYWSYWSRYIYINRYMDIPKPVYSDLLNIVKDKDYFVLTTNVDHCFQKSGFDKHRLFYTQGDYGLWQCETPCHNKTYDNEDVVIKMVKLQKDMKVPANLVPHCPLCGRPMTMNLRADNTFVEDEGWHKAAGRYDDFIRRHKNLNILFLELGTGYNTPGIIKYPFWQMTHAYDKATYACINLGQAEAPTEIEDKSICINADIGTVFKKLV